MKLNLQTYSGARGSLIGTLIREGGWKRPRDGITEVRASVVSTTVPRAENMPNVALMATHLSAERNQERWNLWVVDYSSYQGSSIVLRRGHRGGF